MGSFKNYALAGILAIAASTTARAADLLPPPPMPYAPVPVEVGSGWYLRGDIGLSNQSVDRLSNSQDGPDIEKLDLGFDSAPFVGGGIGYQFNNWFRADITGEYRGKANFHGLERYTDSTLALGYGTDEYRASKSEVLGMANVYFDLGTWNGITPFIGAGVGGSYNKIDHYLDVNTVTNGVAYAKADGQWDFAWAVHAGLAYDVTPNFKVELAYRYLHLGDAQTGVVRTYAGTCSLCEPLKFKDIESHDIKIGMRWLLNGPVVAATEPAPIIRKY